jgi:hypothetical protein
MSRFIENPEFDERFSEAVMKVLEPVAHRIAAEARATAPRDTGAYAGAFRVVKGRREYWIVNDDLALIELGTPDGSHPRHRTLYRAAMRVTV